MYIYIAFTVQWILSQVTFQLNHIYKQQTGKKNDFSDEFSN
jgi:hypothetical protein